MNIALFSLCWYYNNNQHVCMYMYAQFSLVLNISVFHSVILFEIYLGMPRTSILGIPTRSKDTSSIPSSSPSSIQSTTTDPGSHLEPICQSSRLSPLRPRVNSILHLFGPWLFEAALISCDVSKTGEQDINPFQLDLI